MKWRECKVRDLWSTRPTDTYFAARKRGKKYCVQAGWADERTRSGDVVWWSHDGIGTNKRWRTKEAAIAWCEADATTPTEAAVAALRALEGGV